MTIQAESAKTRIYFDKAAPTWDLSNTVDDRKIARILGLFQFPKYAKILDVACGTGALIPSLLKFDPACLHAIDLSPAMIDIAKKKYADIEFLRLFAADFYTFGGSEYDVITIYNAYPHFTDKALFSRQLQHLLKPGGRFIIVHGIGRHAINGCHASKRDRALADILESCEKEAAALGNAFEYDIMLDREDYYVLSGVAR